MLRVIMQQLKLMFHRWGFWLGMTAVLTVTMLNILMAAYINKDLDITQQQAAVYISLVRYGAPLYSIFLLLYPFLLLLPFVFSYRKDDRLHIQPILMNRMGVGRYYAANLIVCFIGSFLIFFIPFLLGEAINSILFQNPNHLSFSYNDLAHVSGDSIMIETVRSAVPFTELYFYSPHMYNLLYNFFFSAFAGLLAIFVYSISYWIKKYDVLLLLPIYLLIQIQSRADMLIENSGGIYFNVNMSAYITVDYFYGQSLLYIILLCVGFLGFSLISVAIKCKKDQLN